MENLEDQVNDAVEVMNDLRETDIEKPMKPMALEAAVEATIRKEKQEREEQEQEDRERGAGQ